MALRSLLVCRDVVDVGEVNNWKGGKSDWQH